MDMYFYFNNSIQGVENIKEMVNCKIDSYSELLEDEEVKEKELKLIFVDFALEIRTQINLLSNSINELNRLNKDFILNGSFLPDNKIDTSVLKFKKELLKYKY